MNDQELLDAYRAARADLTPSTFDHAAGLAGMIAERDAARRDSAHASFHGRRDLRYGRVERRAGYRGQTVCLDCYRSRPWDGRYDRLSVDR